MSTQVLEVYTTSPPPVGGLADLRSWLHFGQNRMMYAVAKQGTAVAAKNSYITIASELLWQARIVPAGSPGVPSPLPACELLLTSGDTVLLHFGAALEVVPIPTSLGLELPCCGDPYPAVP